MKIKLFLFAAMLLLSISSYADYDFVRNGIYYLVTSAEDKTVEVAQSDTYSGDIYIPSTVTYMGQTYTVTRIGYDAFSGCRSLTSITIPNSVNIIEQGAFYDCTGLTSITIPNSVTYIGAYAFYGCSGLTSITIPNSVTKIENGVFGYCSGLTSMKVDSGNAYYDSRNNCNAIIETSSNTLIAGCKSTVIPNSVTSIGDQAFYYCTGLTSITIPNSVTSIGDQAFYYCTGLTSITIPNSVTYIGAYAFYGCSGLTSITIPNSVTKIENEVFGYCSGLTSMKVDSGNAYYDSRNNCNAIIETSSNTLIAGCKSTVIPNSVTSIGDWAFAECTGLTSITLPDSLTSIGSYAFANCYSLTSITIPDGVTSIGDYAFAFCYSLTSITIPDGVTSIGDYAFWDCTSLTSITLPNSVTSIGSFAFAYCTNLISVESKIKVPFAFGSNAFTDISSNCVLTVPSGKRSAYIAAGWTVDVFKGGIVEVLSPTIPFADANVKALCVANWDTNGDGELSVAEAEDVTDLGEVFKGNTSITSFNELSYFTGLTTLGEWAFGGCTSLTSVNLPEGLIKIDGSALRGTAITTLTIPASVTNIVVDGYGGITEECTSLMNINVEEGNSRYYSVDGVVFTEDEALVGTNGRGLVLFPQGRGGSYEIPNGVTAIGTRAFVTCANLTSVTIPGTVTSVGDCAFWGCVRLTNVYCYAVSVPATGGSVFDGSNNNYAVLFVPAASLEAYRTTAPWSSFCFIVAIGELNTETVEIASAADLANFASRVNAGEIAINARLKADIDFTAYPNVMIGDGILYRGEFDGAGHSITLAMQRSYEYAALFHDFAGYVHDLTVTGTITTSAKFAAGIASVTRNATIERCQSRVDIISTINGDGTHGGIVAVSYARTVIRDCLVSGSITGSQTNCCGGVSGWAGGETDISNCLIRSQFTVDISGSDLLARNSSNVISTNNYFQGEWNAANNCGNVTLLTENQVKSGEACYRLNNGRTNDNMVWYQTLSVDDFPVPDNRHLPVSYTNGSYVNAGTIQINDATTSLSIATMESGKNVVFTHNFNGNWESLYLPFAIDYDAIRADFVLAEIDGVIQHDDNNDGIADITVLSIMGLRGQMTTPNTPYLIRAKNPGKQTLLFYNVTVYPTEEATFDCSSFSTRYDFTGSYKTLYSSSLTNRYIAQGGELVKGASKLAPCRWYMKATARTGSLNLPNRISIMPVEDVITGVEDLDANIDINDNEGIYNLAGQRLNKMQKGINIKEGKKVLIK